MRTEQGTLKGVVESEEEVEEGGFPSPARPHNCRNRALSIAQYAIYMH